MSVHASVSDHVVLISDHSGTLGMCLRQQEADSSIPQPVAYLQKILRMRKVGRGISFIVPMTRWSCCSVFTTFCLHDSRATDKNQSGSKYRWLLHLFHFPRTYYNTVAAFWSWNGRAFPNLENSRVVWTTNINVMHFKTRTWQYECSLSQQVQPYWFSLRDLMALLSGKPISVSCWSAVSSTRSSSSSSNIATRDTNTDTLEDSYSGWEIHGNCQDLKNNSIWTSLHWRWW